MAERSIAVRAERLLVAVSIAVQVAAVALQTHSIATLTLAQIRTIITTHTAAIRHPHLQVEATLAAIQVVATTLVVLMAAVKLDDSYEEDISLFVLGAAVQHNSFGAGF